MNTTGFVGSFTQLTGTGSLSVGGMVSDVDLIFDETNGYEKVFTVDQLPDQSVTIHMDATKGGAMGAGYKGNGSLTIKDGRQIISTTARVGLHAGSEGTVLVSGSSTHWETGMLYVGHDGNGTMQIEEGALVTSGSGAFIARAETSVGEMIVSGTNTRWEISGANLIMGGGNLNLTTNGKGSLTIEEGGVVEVKAKTTRVHNLSSITLKDDGRLNTYDLRTTGALIIELSDTEKYGVFDVENTLTLGGTFEITQGDDFMPSAGDEFQFFIFTTGTGSFTTVSGFDLVGDLEWDFSRLETEGIVSVIPEPSTLWLVVGAAVGGYTLSRCRRKRDGVNACRA